MATAFHWRGAATQRLCPPSDCGRRPERIRLGVSSEVVALLDARLRGIEARIAELEGYTPKSVYLGPAPEPKRPWWKRW